jgi:hypothetical protein
MGIVNKTSLRNHCVLNMEYTMTFCVVFIGCLRQQYGTIQGEYAEMPALQADALGFRSMPDAPPRSGGRVLLICSPFRLASQETRVGHGSDDLPCGSGLCCRQASVIRFK